MFEEITLESYSLHIELYPFTLTKGYNSDEFYLLFLIQFIYVGCPSGLPKFVCKPEHFLSLDTSYLSLFVILYLFFLNKVSEVLFKFIFVFV